VHHDSRTYIELRYDDMTCDVVLVSFRDRGLLPVEVTSEQFSTEMSQLTGDSKEELRHCLYALIERLYGE